MSNGLLGPKWAFGTGPFTVKENIPMGYVGGGGRGRNAKKKHEQKFQKTVYMLPSISFVQVLLVAPWYGTAKPLSSMYLLT